MHHIRSLVFLFWITFLFACSDSGHKKENTSSPRIKNLSSIKSPKNGSRITIGDSIKFEIGISNPDVKIDSIAWRDAFGNSFISQKRSLSIPSDPYATGNNVFTLKVYMADNKVETKNISITLFSDISPENYTYRVLNRYPHDTDAFVQGLLIDNGVLYESTGQKGFSSLRIVDLISGEVIKRRNLEDRFFGEGIAIYKGNIYMLTYKSQEGMVYNKSTMEFVRSIYYPTEGWGITMMNDTLVMSDGTENLYFMEPDGFTEVKRIEVYDNEGPINNLNELEYFNEKIYANRWFTDLIYEIDPLNGKVTGIIDLEGLMNSSDFNTDINVLNGIAFDQNQGSIYVTGKNWPTLFEIEFIKKPNNI